MACGCDGVMEEETEIYFDTYVKRDTYAKIYTKSSHAKSGTKIQPKAPSTNIEASLINAGYMNCKRCRSKNQ